MSLFNADLHIQILVQMYSYMFTSYTYFRMAYRKLAAAIIAIQRHPIIQTLGDRIAKVTCIAEEPSDRLPRPLFKNITLDATFGVAEPP